MATVYEQFDKATRDVSAFAVFKGPDYIGRVVFKRGTSGLRTTCFAQVWGLRMAKGMANGGGYDKDSAAAENAISKIKPEDERDPAPLEHLKAWQDAMKGPEGERWNRRLDAAGYNVVHVID